MKRQWKAASGYVQGLGHIQWNEPCQDRATDYHNDDFHAIVLADGAGSCRLSAVGADLVMDTMTEKARELFDTWYTADEPAPLIENLLLDAINEEVKKHEGSVRMDFSCTLLFVLVKDNRFLAGHVGDGLIVQRKKNKVSVLSHPENGRFINETYFITMAPLHEHFRIYRGTLDTYTDFMLMSDGAATSFYTYVDREVDFYNMTMIFNHLVENSEEIVQEELQDLLHMIRENTDDDCAMSVMTSHTTDVIEEADLLSMVGETLSNEEEDVEGESYSYDHKTGYHTEEDLYTEESASHDKEENLNEEGAEPCREKEAIDQEDAESYEEEDFYKEEVKSYEEEEILYEDEAESYEEEDFYEEETQSYEEKEAFDQEEMESHEVKETLNEEEAESYEEEADFEEEDDDFYGSDDDRYNYEDDVFGGEETSAVDIATYTETMSLSSQPKVEESLECVKSSTKEDVPFTNFQPKYTEEENRAETDREESEADDGKCPRIDCPSEAEIFPSKD